MVKRDLAQLPQTRPFTQGHFFVKLADTALAICGRHCAYCACAQGSAEALRLCPEPTTKKKDDDDVSR